MYIRRRCLGIYIGHTIGACNEKGWIEKIRQIDKLLQIWKKRNFTTFGKITILKCLAIPKIIHIGQNCEYKDSYLQELKRFFRFYLAQKRQN